MSISKRHHYIPQFLIKRFADTDGKLYLYNKETKRFAKERQSTRSVFFEMNRNNVEIDGGHYDNLEKLYANLDERFAGALKDVIDNRNMSVENIGSLLILTSSLKWRLPVNDKEFNTTVDTLPYDKIPFEIKVKNDDGSDHTEAIEHLLSSELFKKSRRVILPFLPLYDKMKLSPEKIMNAYLNCYIYNHDNYTSILGDAPLIEDTNAGVHHFGNFILPVGSNDSFICSDFGNQKVTNALFHITQDLAVFHQSEKYVVCKEKVHLENIIRMYEMTQSEGQVDQIMKQAFKFT